MAATDTTGSSDISLTVLMIVNNQDRSRCDMVADSVVLLQTPAVAEPTEVGLS